MPNAGALMAPRVASRAGRAAGVDPDRVHPVRRQPLTGHGRQGSAALAALEAGIRLMKRGRDTSASLREVTLAQPLARVQSDEIPAPATMIPSAARTTPITVAAC